MRRPLPLHLLGVMLAGAIVALMGCQGPAGEPESLSSLRVSLELPDCPATEPDQAAIDGGLPQTQLPCLGSQATVNLAGLDRRPMLINLWAQWCEPCRAEAPHLARAQHEYPEISFLGINYGDPRPEWALEFAHLAGWDYPHVQDLDKQLRDELSIPGIPVTLFVAADGRIVKTLPGSFDDYEELKSAIEQHLIRA